MPVLLDNSDLTYSKILVDNIMLQYEKISKVSLTQRQRDNTEG